MNKLIILGILGLLIVSMVGVVSADTLIAGQIYNADYSDIIPDASIVIFCGTNSMNTTSLYDGTYVIKFESGLCEGPNNIKVDATKDNLIGSNTGFLIECNDTNCTGDYFSIVNLAMDVKPPVVNPPSSSSSSRSSYRGYYNCGNNICDTGETGLTCPEDCAKDLLENEMLELGFNENTQEETDQNQEIITQGNEEEKESFVSGITGAAIGFGKTKAGIGIGALIIVLIAIIIAILVNRNK